jgi:N-acetylmuramoyl-L-alanine amidase
MRLAALAALVSLAACATAEVPADLPSRAATDTAAPVEAARGVSEAERACLAEAIYYEAGQSRVGFEAVAHVVVNRARDPRFPRTVCGVITDKCQFSYRCEGKSLALSNGARRAKAHRVAEEVLTGAPDPTSGALFFHSARVAPGWFNTRARVGEFGGNIFYR